MSEGPAGYCNVMSEQQNVEIVRHAEEALGRRDIEAWISYCHPNVEAVIGRNLVEGGSYRGHAGMRRSLADVSETWENILYERQDIRAIDDCVVSLGQTTFASKRAASPTVRVETAWVYKLSEGKIISARTYTSHREALEAVGLAE